MEWSNIELFDPNNHPITGLYSWSVDGVCWTSWSTYDVYKSIRNNIDSDFYLRIRFVGSIGSVLVNGLLNNCYNISLDSTSSFLTDFCGDPNLFQPYNNLDCALQLQSQLSDSVICMLGIPVYYVKVSPREDTKDYTFKDFILHDVESIKQLKLMLQDGALPSSNPRLTEFDFDWDVDWNVEISKNQFAAAFGDTSFPKQRDFVYVPLMGRLWQVNAAYDEKAEGLMWRSTTWKLALVKYNENTAIENGGYDEMIDSWVKNTYENTFGEYERNEQSREVGATPISTPRFAATNLYDIFMEDAVRKQFTKDDVAILDKQYNHRSTVVARNIYKFKNENGCVVYQKQVCGSAGTLMFMLETTGSLDKLDSKEIVEFGEAVATLSFNNSTHKFNLDFMGMNTELEQFNTYMVICRWDKKTYNISMDVFKYVAPSGIPAYMARPEMYQFDFENPVAELTTSYNEDLDMRCGKTAQIHGYPIFLSNIKYYNIMLPYEEAIKESLKYVTTSETCVINDPARPINSGHGYAVR